jgi:hypothetical protein
MARVNFLTHVILRPWSRGRKTRQRPGAPAPGPKSARRAAQRVDEPVELDGVSYSAEVLSTVEG